MSVFKEMFENNKSMEDAFVQANTPKVVEAVRGHIKKKKDGSFLVQWMKEGKTLQKECKNREEAKKFLKDVKEGLEVEEMNNQRDGSAPMDPAKRREELAKNIKDGDDDKLSPDERREKLAKEQAKESVETPVVETAKCSICKLPVSEGEKNPDVKYCSGHTKEEWAKMKESVVLEKTKEEVQQSLKTILPIIYRNNQLVTAVWWYSPDGHVLQYQPYDKANPITHDDKSFNVPDDMKDVWLKGRNVSYEGFNIALITSTPDLKTQLSSDMLIEFRNLLQNKMGKKVDWIVTTDGDILLEGKLHDDFFTLMTTDVISETFLNMKKQWELMFEGLAKHSESLVERYKSKLLKPNVNEEKKPEAEGTDEVTAKVDTETPKEIVKDQEGKQPEAKSIEATKEKEIVGDETKEVTDKELEKPKTVKVPEAKEEAVVNEADEEKEEPVEEPVEEPKEEEPEAKPTDEKEFFGSKADNFYYLEAKGKTAVLVDAEGQEVFKGDSEDMIQFIQDAVKELEIDSISIDVFNKYILPEIEEPEEVWQEPKDEVPEEVKEEPAEMEQAKESKVVEGSFTSGVWVILSNSGGELARHFANTGEEAKKIASQLAVIMEEGDTLSMVGGESEQAKEDLGPTETLIPEETKEAKLLRLKEELQKLKEAK